MFLSNLAIARPVLALVFAATLVIFGLISYKDLSIDLMPNVEFPIITITTIFRGADPETIETEVTDKIEDDLATLAGIKELYSYSAENVSVIVVQFELEVNLDTATQDVRDRLSRLQRSLPEDIEPPIVQKIDFQSIPIVSVAVSGDVTPQDLASFVKDTIKPRIESSTGVGRVDILGIRNREIRVWLNHDAMASYGVSAFEIVGALQSSNIQIPSGRVETGDREYIVVTTGEIKYFDEFKDIVVATRNGTLVRLSDVARVEDGLEDLRSLSRLNGASAVSLQVFKLSGANTISVAEKVKEEVELLKAELPPGITVTVPLDTSVFIRDSFEETINHILGGGLLAILVVLLFLGNFRTTIIAAITIPTSIISTFIFMRALDFSLNMLTLLAIALSVGMLIDDAIVVLENIYRHNEKGEPSMEAARKGAKEIGFAVLATTLCIVAVFIPVAFMRGLIGRFIYQYGITVAVAVATSYLVAMTVTPMLASRFLSGEKSPFILFKWFDAGFQKLENGYRWLIEAALRRKGLTIFFAVIALVAALFAFAATPSEFESEVDDSQFQVNIELPVGSSLSR
ncbi:MAG TPA: efflux RND transporter permease subunit, partial [Firmicutes bacterium]|nr:efflux RND transporter permease subunit [Bacillota bacterium]